MQLMTIEIWSDIVCPWCYIGKRRFEKALARFAHRDQVPGAESIPKRESHAAK